MSFSWVWSDGCSPFGGAYTFLEEHYRCDTCVPLGHVTEYRVRARFTVEHLALGDNGLGQQLRMGFGAAQEEGAGERWHVCKPGSVVQFAITGLSPSSTRQLELSVNQGRREPGSQWELSFLTTKTVSFPTLSLQHSLVGPLPSLQSQNIKG